MREIHGAPVSSKKGGHSPSREAAEEEVLESAPETLSGWAAGVGRDVEGKQDDQEWRNAARVTETPCECGSVHVLDSYGVVEGGMGAYAACFDCSRVREVKLDEAPEELSLEERHRRLVESFNRMRHRALDAERESKGLRARAEKAEREAAVARAEMNATKSDLAGWIRRAGEVAMERDALRADRNELSEQLDEIEEAVDQARNALHAAIGGAEDAPHLPLREGVAALRAELERVKGEREAIDLKLHGALGERDSLCVRVECAEEQRDAARAEASRLRAGLERASGELRHAYRERTPSIDPRLVARAIGILECAALAPAAGEDSVNLRRTEALVRGFEEDETRCGSEYPGAFDLPCELPRGHAGNHRILSLGVAGEWPNPSPPPPPPSTQLGEEIEAGRDPLNKEDHHG